MVDTAETENSSVRPYTCAPMAGSRGKLRHGPPLSPDPTIERIKEGIFEGATQDWPYKVFVNQGLLRREVSRAGSVIVGGEDFELGIGHGVVS